MVVVYPLGIPLMYGVLLYRNRKYLFEGNAVPAPPPAASVDVSNPLVSSESNGRTSDKEISANEEVSGRGTDSEIDLPDSVKRLRFLW